MKRFIGLCIVLMLTGASLLAEDAPVRIQMENLTNENYPGIVVPRIIVTATADSIVIKDIVVNKGHCPMNANRKSSFPWTLSYGEQAIASYSSACHVLKVDVQTNQGDWSVEY